MANKYLIQNIATTSKEEHLKTKRYTAPDNPTALGIAQYLLTLIRNYDDDETNNPVFKSFSRFARFYNFKKTQGIGETNAKLQFIKQALSNKKNWIYDETNRNEDSFEPKLYLYDTENIIRLYYDLIKKPTQSNIRWFFSTLLSGLKYIFTLKFIRSKKFNSDLEYMQSILNEDPVLRFNLAIKATNEFVRQNLELGYKLYTTQKKSKGCTEIVFEHVTFNNKNTKARIIYCELYTLGWLLYFAGVKYNNSIDPQQDSLNKYIVRYQYLRDTLIQEIADPSQSLQERFNNLHYYLSEGIIAAKIHAEQLTDCALTICDKPPKIRDSNLHNHNVTGLILLLKKQKALKDRIFIPDFLQNIGSGIVLALAIKETPTIREYLTLQEKTRNLPVLPSQGIRHKDVSHRPAPDDSMSTSNSSIEIDDKKQEDVAITGSGGMTARHKHCA